jgi:hypothetical protein
VITKDGLVVTTRADLVLAQAKRARTPADCGQVGSAAAECAATASHAELDKLEEAHAIAREKLDAYTSGRVIPLRRRSKEG